jgi:hypothetical protein
MPETGELLGMEKAVARVWPAPNRPSGRAIVRRSAWDSEEVVVSIADLLAPFWGPPQWNHAATASPNCPGNRQASMRPRTTFRWPPSGRPKATDGAGRLPVRHLTETAAAPWDEQAGAPGTEEPSRTGLLASRFERDIWPTPWADRSTPRVPGDPVDDARSAPNRQHLAALPT